MDPSLGINKPVWTNIHCLLFGSGTKESKNVLAADEGLNEAVCGRERRAGICFTPCSSLQGSAVAPLTSLAPSKVREITGLAASLLSSSSFWAPVICRLSLPRARLHPLQSVSLHLQVCAV